MQATCPSGSYKALSPLEISQFVDQRLSNPDMCSESASSDAFKNSLKDFIEKAASALKKTRRILQLDENIIGDENSNPLENVAAKISGISYRQLKVQCR